MKNNVPVFIFVYAAAWLFFANYNLYSSDVIVEYQLKETRAGDSEFPTELALGTSEYRVTDAFVVRQTGNFPPVRYDKCSIMDLENWECEYDDGSARFGFRDGLSYVDTQSDFYANVRGVSRFEYVWNHIQWSWASGGINAFMVLFIPFIV